MEPRTIIDTDILIDFLRNKKEAVAFITQLEEKKTLLFTTKVNRVGFEAIGCSSH